MNQNAKLFFLIAAAMITGFVTIQDMCYGKWGWVCFDLLFIWYWAMRYREKDSEF